MSGYIEVMARKKAHELVLLVYNILKLKELKGKDIENLKASVSNLAAELFEAHGRLFADEKIKHISKSRGYLYEVKYYLNLLNDLGKMNRYNIRQLNLKIELLDKLLLGMIRSKRQRIYSQGVLFDKINNSAL